MLIAGAGVPSDEASYRQYDIDDDIHTGSRPIPNGVEAHA